jgi:hypothetical protein
MRRREFITLIGTAAAWPFAACAQQGEHMRRIGVLNGRSRDDPEYQARMAITALVRASADRALSISSGPTLCCP